MNEFVLHPDAVKDFEEIWEYLAADNLVFDFKSVAII